MTLLLDVAGTPPHDGSVSPDRFFEIGSDQRGYLFGFQARPVQSHPFGGICHRLQICRRHASNPLRQLNDLETIGQRGPAEKTWNELLITGNIGYSELDLFAESTAAEHTLIDFVDVVRRPHQEHLVAGIELAHQHQSLLYDLLFMLRNVAAVIGPGKNTVHLVDEQNRRAVLLRACKDLFEFLRTWHIGRSNLIEAPPGLCGDKLRD